MYAGFYVPISMKYLNQTRQHFQGVPLPPKPKCNPTMYAVTSYKFIYLTFSIVYISYMSINYTDLETSANIIPVYNEF